MIDPAAGGIIEPTGGVGLYSATSRALYEQFCATRQSNANHAGSFESSPLEFSH